MYDSRSPYCTKCEQVEEVTGQILSRSSQAVMRKWTPASSHQLHLERLGKVAQPGKDKGEEGMRES